MKSLFRMLAVLLLLGTAGCASFSRPPHVLISVVDEAGQPLSGVWVSNRFYAGKLPRKLTASDAITGPDGLAMLMSKEIEMYYLYIKDATGEYGWKSMTGLSSNQKTLLRERFPDHRPISPDIVFTIESDQAKVRREEDRRLKMEKLEDEARLLSEQKPDFWPKNKPDSEWVKDDIGWVLLEHRWNSASKEPLGTPADTEAIRRIVVERMKPKDGEVHEIRWLTPNKVMVDASRYGGALAGAGYTFVLDKRDGQWIVIARYMNWIS